MNAFRAILFRELRALFSSPLAYVFLAVYVLLSGLATWNLARFFDTARADLTPFFQFQPWLLALLAPAIGMRLWSEDLKSRSIDLYFTSPLSLSIAHAAKAIAGVCVLICALAFCLPYWGIVSYLGSPDHSLIALSFLHLVLLASLFLTVSLMFSALTRQQVLALVLSVMVNLLILVCGLPLITASLSGILPASAISWIQGFGLLDGLIRMQRGVLSFSDILSYVLFISVFFVVGVSVLQAKRFYGQSKGMPWAAFTLGLIILALPLFRTSLDLVFGKVRADVTGYKLNTLSEGARKLASALREPVTLTLYYNETVGQDYPDIRSHAERVKALLEAFQQASDGKLKLRFVNPEPFSAGEDDAITSGITSIQTEGIDPLYFGLAGTNLVDDTELIPFLSPDRDDRLEFEIASLISRLDQTSRPHIAILSDSSALSERTGPANMSSVQAAITDQYEVSWLTSESLSLPESVQTIMLVSPRRVSDYTRYLINQFLLNGGHLIVLSDPAPVLEDTRALSLTQWFDAWGVTASGDILTDSALGLPVTVATPTGNRTENQPLFPGPGPANRNQQDFLVSALKQKINFGGTGWFNTATETGLKFTPLVSSSPSPSRLSADDFQKSDQTPADIRAHMQPMSGPVTLVARLSGNAPVLFPEGPPEPDLPDDPVLRPLAQAEIRLTTHLTKANSEAEIVLISDTDFLFDAFYINPQTGEALADNQALILSLLDQFAGNPELAALRARPPAIRPMTRVTELRSAAEAQYLAEQDALETVLADLQRQMNTAPADSQAALRQDYLDARKDLRDLQRNFRSRIDTLDTWLRGITIWLPIGLILLAGMSIPLPGRRRK